jgi:hypothetical protein
MRILGEDDDKAQSRVTLYLTKAEAGEMKDSLKALLEGPQDSHHHISSSDFSKEITVCLYSEDDPKALSHFDERSRKIILHDV